MSIDIDNGEADIDQPSVDEQLDVVTVSPVVQRAIIVALVVVGGILLVTLIGSILSRSGDEEPVQDATIVVTTTTGVESSPTSVEAGPTTTVAAAEVTTTTVAVAPAAAFAENPTNTQLVLWTFNERRVIVVDVDNADATELDLRDVGVPLVERIVSAGSKLVVQSLGDYYAVSVDGDRTLLDTRGVVQAVGDDELWATDASAGDRETTPFRIDFEGIRTQLPTVPARTFPFGWFGDVLLVGGGGAGGIYMEAADGYERIADGELVAARNGFVLARQCDTALSCTMTRLDLIAETSTSHELPAGFEISALWWLEDTTSPSLDAVLGVSNDLGSPALWDLNTGSVEPLGIGQGRGATFSPDGAWVFVSVDNDIVAYHRLSGVEVVVPIPITIDSPNGLQLAALSTTEAG